MRARVPRGDLGNILIRGGNPAALAPGAPTPLRRAAMDHGSFGIAPWDNDGLKAELDERGLTGRADTGGKGRHSRRGGVVEELSHHHARRVRPPDQQRDEGESQGAVNV